MISRYELKHQLPSCDVDVDLIKALESYVKQKAILGKEGEIATIDKFKVVIDDRTGTEELSSIDDSPSRRLPNATSRVTLRFEQLTPNAHIELTISLDPDKRYSVFRIACKAEGAREKTDGLAKGLDEIVRRNHNMH